MFAGGWLVIVVAPETVSVAGSGNNNTFLTKIFLVLDKVQAERCLYQIVFMFNTSRFNKSSENRNMIKEGVILKVLGLKSIFS